MERRVLVIDDDADTLELIATMIDNKMHTFTAVNLKDAITILKKDFIDVVVCDINLGKENGFKFIEDLKNNLLEIPFIIVSGDVDNEREKRAKGLGALAIFEKPFHFEVLLETINKSLDPITRFQASKAKRNSIRETA